MIDSVGTVNLFVEDQERAREFWVDKLGFELRQDMPYGENRWIAVAPKGATTELILYKVDQNWEHFRDVVGKAQPITFNVTDMQALHADLTAKGVRFALEPEAQPWGTQAIIMDDDGNMVILVERSHGHE